MGERTHGSSANTAFHARLNAPVDPDDLKHKPEPKADKHDAKKK